MSAIDDAPQNYNFLSPLNFAFSIKKAPNVRYFTQAVNIPGLTLPPATSVNPFVNIPYPGDHITFDDLSVVFKVNEDMSDFLEIFNWLRELGFPETFEEYEQIASRPAYLGTGIKSDLSIIVSNSSNVPTIECVIKDAFPISLSGFQLDSRTPDVQFVTCTAVFKYTNYVMNTIV
jgi:hypothetical protein